MQPHTQRLLSWRARCAVAAQGFRWLVAGSQGQGSSQVVIARMRYRVTVQVVRVARMRYRVTVLEFLIGPKRHTYKHASERALPRMPTTVGVMEGGAWAASARYSVR
jgi:hypothetical protein